MQTKSREAEVYATSPAHCTTAVGGVPVDAAGLELEDAVLDPRDAVGVPLAGAALLAAAAAARSVSFLSSIVGCSAVGGD
jgi:hypothetical protein